MDNEPQELREAVRRRYAERALRVIEPTSEGCCTSAYDAVARDLYSTDEAASLPAEAVQASLGCGNPTALASLQAGECVLDLGSGGGIDVLLAARRVGPTGFVYGLDMTDEMLALAQRNQAAEGVTNVAFLKGFIENIPLPESSIDVIISNCVINLSADKRKVLDDAFRVLRPGGRLAISDMVVRGTLPASVRQDMEAWAGCVAGALEESEYREMLKGAGFEAVSIEATRFHAADTIAISDDGCGSASGADCGTTTVEGGVVSAFVQARKPDQ
jgi:arsenite methyltransferase